MGGQHACGCTTFAGDSLRILGDALLGRADGGSNDSNGSYRMECCRTHVLLGGPPARSLFFGSAGSFAALEQSLYRVLPAMRRKQRPCYQRRTGYINIGPHD